MTIKEHGQLWWRVILPHPFRHLWRVLREAAHEAKIGIQRMLWARRRAYKLETCCHCGRRASTMLSGSAQGAWWYACPNCSHLPITAAIEAKAKQRRQSARR